MTRTRSLSLQYLLLDQSVTWVHNVKTFVTQKPFCSQMYYHGYQNSILKLSTEH